MIITRQRQVPWSWVWLSQLPFAFWMFTTCLQNTAFTLSLKKFVDNPALIAATLSLATLPVLVIAPLVNYLSDRIWTRFGRRKPFYVFSNCVGAACMALMPLAHGYWSLTALLWAFQAANAFGKTFFPLSQEVIPVPQRGRGSAIHTIMFQVGILLYYSLMLGRFDDVYAHGPLAAFGPLDGERFTYWTCALLMLLPLLIVAYGIKEMPIVGALSLRDERTGARFTPLTFLRRFFVDVFDRQWAVLYLLLFGGALYGLGLGSLQALLYTDQWGYSLQDMGTNVALGTLLMIPLVAVCGWIADRYSKMRVYLVAMGVATVLNLGYFLFVRIALPDHRPALWQILLFGELIAICGQVVHIVSWPLIFEYIPRRKMGTASAGMEMMQALFGAILPPLVGLWVAGYSTLFCAPPGARVRIVLEQPATASALTAPLAAAATPGAPALFAEPFFSPGQGGETSRQWTLRSADPEGSALIHRRKTLEHTLATLQRAEPPASAETLAAARADLAALEAALAARAAAFRARVATAFADRLVPDGAQILASAWTEAPVLAVPSPHRVTRRQVDTLDHELRAAHPEVIQVEHASAVPGADPAAQGVVILLHAAPAEWTALRARVLATLAALPAKPERPSEHLGRWARLKAALRFDAPPPPAVLRAELGGVLAPAAASATPVVSVPLLRLDLAALESFTGRDREPLQAALRQTGVRAVRLAPRLAGDGFTVLAAYWRPPGSAAEAEHALYEETRAAAATHALTVAQPVVLSDYAARQYDYFSAYLLTILGGGLAILVTLLVVRFEKRGVIRKLAVEEEAASA